MPVAAPEPVRSQLFDLPTSRQPQRHRSHRRRSKPRWYARWPARIVALLLLIVAGSAGYVWVNVHRTMGEINSLSVLPPQIQDHTVSGLEGTPGALPARTPRTVPSGPPPTVVVPQYEGPSPGGPIRQTAIARTHAGSPAASPGAEGTPGGPTPVPCIVESTPLPVGEAQCEALLAAGMTFDTGPAQTAVAEASALRTRTPTPSSS